VTASTQERFLRYRSCPDRMLVSLPLVIVADGRQCIPTASPPPDQRKAF